MIMIRTLVAHATLLSFFPAAMGVGPAAPDTKAVMNIEMAATTFSNVLACGVSEPDWDKSTWKEKARTAANQRSGTSTTCAALGVAQTSDVLDYHCFASGENGSWTYLRNTRTNVQGWVKDSLLKDGGSVIRC